MEAYQQLELKFGRWVDRPYMVACSSGTAALHLALETLQLPPGSRVIVPEFTMVSCARAVTMAGLKPLFVDCGSDLLLDPLKVSKVMSPLVSAILPVHIYGRRCDMTAFSNIAQENNCAIVEDLAEAHGILPHPNTDAACWSFYKNKIVAGEEGGMISFKYRKQLDLARQLRSVGFTDSHDFLHVPRGMNYRLANALAKLILKSLLEANTNIILRRAVSKWYDELIPVAWIRPEREACWVYDVLLPNIDAVSVVNLLNSLGHAARLAFKPMSEQPEYRGDYLHLAAYEASRSIIYLPINPGMSQQDVAEIVGALKTVVNEQPWSHSRPPVE